MCAVVAGLADLDAGREEVDFDEARERLGLNSPFISIVRERSWPEQ